MSLTPDDVRAIAHLARLSISEADIPVYTRNLTRILDFVAQLEAADTEGVVPMAHPLNMAQRLRPDVVTEGNQRELFQQNAPAVAAGLYLVPKVIE
ncbi:MAG TPA: Asp-tRNA(Asn)/Glu-tRNA(Gln) amidotransferase subunit GatC [Gammaproteobacteria bacterium]|nr:Asp-tRNA(Asn)/Glu-tRNA(Gln) amidotransferase subunit GatC [Gammaproteobacteria bacterium]